MSVFEQMQTGRPDVYVRLEVDKDEAVALYLNIAVDDSGAELLDLACSDVSQVREFFRTVDAAKAEWVKLGGQALGGW